MAMKLLTPSSINLFHVGLAMVGDGSSKSVTVDLTKAPFLMEFKGNPPSDVTLSGISVRDASNAVDPSFTATASMHESMLTVTFNNPPVAAASPTSQGAGYAYVDVAFAYSGAA